LKRVAALGVATLATSLAVLAAAAGGITAVAELEVTQTCPARVAPNSSAAVTAAVRNAGDEAFETLVVEGDAGTPEETDDFALTFQSGDTNGNGLLDPGETWTYGGSYTLANEDSTNTVGVEALSVAGNNASDLDPCTTDVIQTPVPGVIAGVAPVRGTVLVRLPGTNTFVPLRSATEIPIGSQIDTTRGEVRLVSGVGGGQTNTANFFDGLFTIRQRRALRAVMQLVMGGGNFRTACRSRASTRSLASVDATRPRRTVRRLWGSGKGRFETRGRYSSATVRGTRWLVQDRCDGTLTRVTQGSVTVRDLRRRRTIIVRAGRSYLARAPGA
jgi:hypothetical protein